MNKAIAKNMKPLTTLITIIIHEFIMQNPTKMTKIWKFCLGFRGRFPMAAELSLAKLPFPTLLHTIIRMKSESEEILDLVDEVIGQKSRADIYSEGLTNFRVVNIFFKKF